MFLAKTCISAILVMYLVMTSDHTLPLIRSNPTKLSQSPVKKAAILVIIQRILVLIYMIYIVDHRPEMITSALLIVSIFISLELIYYFILEPFSGASFLYILIIWLLMTTRGYYISFLPTFIDGVALSSVILV